MDISGSITERLLWRRFLRKLSTPSSRLSLLPRPYPAEAAQKALAVATHGQRKRPCLLQEPHQREGAVETPEGPGTETQTQHMVRPPRCHHKGSKRQAEPGKYPRRCIQTRTTPIAYAIAEPQDAQGNDQAQARQTIAV